MKAPRSRKVPVSVCAVVAIASTACASAVPPPPDVATRPDPVLPKLDHPPARPPAGMGVVVFDSVSGPASVSRVTGTSRTGGLSAPLFSGRPVLGYGWVSYRGRSVMTEMVCPQTPCAAYLPYGDHEVIFEGTESSRSSRFIVTSSDVPRALRASLDARVRPDAAHTIGLVGMVTGAIVGGLGAALLAHESQEYPSAVEPFSVGATVGGATVGLLGVILFLAGHPGAYYDGQGTVWDIVPPAPPPADPKSIGTTL